MSPSSKARTHRLEGVVLHHKEWGEADRLVTLFTRELGKIQAIAKGVRKPRSRKAGHLEPFTRSSIFVARGRTFFILTQAEAREVYSTIKNDLVLLGHASYVVELLTRFTTEEEEQRDLYRLLVKSLTRLNRGDDPLLVVRYYEIRLLDIVGFRPNLFTCALCQAEIQAEEQFFSFLLGGVVCPRCGSHSPDARPVSMLALKYLRHFQRSSYQQALRARIPPPTQGEIEQLMLQYLTHLLERQLRTPGFLKRMQREARKTEK